MSDDWNVVRRSLCWNFTLHCLQPQQLHSRLSEKVACHLRFNPNSHCPLKFTDFPRAVPCMCPHVTDSSTKCLHTDLLWTDRTFYIANPITDILENFLQTLWESSIPYSFNDTSSLGLSWAKQSSFKLEKIVRAVLSVSGVAKCSLQIVSMSSDEDCSAQNTARNWCH
jgi:hypothetical protein